MNISPEPIIVEQFFENSAEELWLAITEVDRMVKWFFDNIPDFKAEVGFETNFDVSTGERNFPHRWTILEVIPNNKIVYHWRYDNYPGEGYVTFEIDGSEDGSNLSVVAEGMHTFPQDVPEFSRESCVGGWQYFINQRLRSYMKEQ